MSEKDEFSAYLEAYLEKGTVPEEEAQEPEGDTGDGGKETPEPETRRRHPFKFLDAYAPEDRDIFFGRDMEIKELYYSVFSRKVTVVFGNSGAGKTSLVQCGFLSRVKPEKVAFFTIRSAISPVKSIENDCIRKLADGDAGGDLFVRLARGVLASRKTVVLFFDQFEEMFILQPVEVRRELALLFKKILEANLDIKIVLGIREEFFARLIEFELVVPDILENRIWVRNMSAMQAKTVIEKPCQVCGVAVEPELPHQVIGALSPGKEGVELPYVQVVMDTLYRRALARDAEHPRLMLADLEIQGGVKNILSNFVEDQIQDMPDAEKARQVLKALITAEGTKRVMSVEEIDDVAANYGEAMEHEALTGILRALVERRILREDPENGLYELRHDALAQTIRQWMTGIEQELMEVRQTLESRFREFETRGTLLDGAALKYIAPYESRLRLNAALLGFIEKSKKEAAKKRRWMMAAVGTGIGLLVISVFGVFGFIKSLETEKQRQRAELKAVEAEEKSKEVKKLLINARHNLGYAYHFKSELSLLDKRYNEARIFSLTALENFKPNQAEVERAKAVGTIISQPDYPIIYSFLGSFTVFCVSFSHDGKLLIAGLANGIIQLWDLKTGNKKATLSGHTDSVWDISCSPDGIVASGSSDKTIRIWDLKNGKEKFVMHGKDTFLGISFSPDGKTLASGSADKTIHLWDIKTGKETTSFKGHTQAVASVSFSPDGNTLASSSYDNTVRLWNIETGKQKAILEGHTNFVMSVSFSPNGKTLASGSHDNTIRLWDVETGKQKSVLQSKYNINSVSFSPDSKTLVSGAGDLDGAWDNTIRFWDVETGKPMSVLQSKYNINSVSFSPDGKTIASGSGDNYIRLWDVKTDKQRTLLQGHKSDVTSVSFSPDGKTLASGSRDKTIRLWDMETRKQKAVLQEEFWSGITSVHFSPDGKILASGSHCTIRLWDIKETGGTKILAACEKINKPGFGVVERYFTNDLRFSPDTTSIAYVYDEDPAAVHLVDVKTGKEKAVLTGHEGSVLCVRFSPDGKTIASGSEDTTIRLWDVDTGTVYAVLTGHNDSVFSIDFSPRGNLLSSGSADNTIRLWDMKNLKNIRVFRGHKGSVLTVNFSPDGGIIASGSEDYTVRLWEVRKNILKAVLEGHENPVLNVSFSANEKLLASGAADNDIILWDLSPLYDERPTNEKIKEAKQKYNLQLVNLELQPIPPERISPHPPNWPKTHPFHWLSKAESGDANAMVQLGIIYDRDNELDKAHHWYTKAIHAGSEHAKERLNIFKQWLTLHKDQYPEAYQKYCRN